VITEEMAEKMGMGDVRGKEVVRDEALKIVL
jgi:hypothetical protein